MNNETVLQNIKAFVKNRLAGEGTGHDWWHAVRVVNIARKIHAVEGGDWLVIELSLLLHDVGDRKVVNKENDDHSISKDFLESQNVPVEIINMVMHIIETMSYSKSFDETEKDNSIELTIAQDADRLDAIGATGIGRAFAYGGSKSRLLYDPHYKTQTFTTSEDYKKSEGTTIHHFYEKLLLIKDGLNTKTAQEIAAKRDEFMRLFLKEFLEEWNGDK